jgi:predicted aconitase
MSAADNTERREFLKTTTGILTGVLVAGSPMALLAPSRAWAVDFAALTSAEGKILLAMTRTIAPHDKLEDAAYAIVVRSIDEDASKSAAALETTRKGIASLGSGFATAKESARIAALKKIEQSEFFGSVRLKTVQMLYATPMAYALFGYEGESFSKGGYLARGFNDLRWLPEVPAFDGGPMPGAQ